MADQPDISVARKPTGPTLPSWNNTPARSAILNFVKQVTDQGGPGFAPPAARIAVFDNDGTLWCEKPMPIQTAFLLGKIGKQAAKDPSLRGKQPWKAVFEKDHEWLAAVITKHYNGDDSDLKLSSWRRGCSPPTPARRPSPMPNRRRNSCAIHRTPR